VQRLAGVLFEVGSRQANRFFAALGQNSDFSPFDDGKFVLADLVALGQIRVEIVFPRENRTAIDQLFSADRKPEPDRALDRTFVGDRQHARQRDIHGARLGIRRRTERGRCTGEHLRRCRELRVRLQADDDFPVHG